MSIPVCRFYQNQTCRFGKNCRYLHPSSQRPPPKLEFKPSKDGSLNYDPTYSVSALALSDDHTSQFNSCQNEGTLSERSSTRESRSLRSQDFQEPTPEKHEVRPVNANKSVHKNICHYFQAYGNCRHGNECRFLHILSDRHDNYQQPASSRRQNGPRNVAEIPPRFRKHGHEIIPSQRAGTEEVSHEHVKPAYKQIAGGPRRDGDRGSPSTERGVCPYFRRGHCNRGDYCRFLHSGDQHVEEGRLASTNHECESTQEDGQENSSLGRVHVEISDQHVRAHAGHPKKTISSSIIRPVIIKQRFTFAELDTIDFQKVRDSEINTIKKRFPRDKITVVEETEDKFSARILFSPTDPDWAFDVHVFELLLIIPSDYPKEMMKVQLPVDQNLPETVRRYIEISITEWLEHKMEQLASEKKVELMFRPFLLWLDRNIEDITMEALKQLKRELVAHAAGMEFIPAHKLQARLRAHSEHLSSDETRSGDSDDLTSDGSHSDDDNDDDSSDDSDDTEMRPKLNIDPEKKGTEIELRHLQLRENASALLFERLKLVLQCERCKNHSDILVTPGKVMSIQCDKCNQNQFVHFRAALIHQFSSVAGYLDLDGCQAFDLIFQDCCVAVTCLSCSKQTRIDGLVSGHLIDGWCQACNARFKLATEAVKFVQLAPSSVDTSTSKVVEIGSTKQKRVAKDPAIREGCPLPEFGTCKHYKHSYRWLRFPCCGKAYPCDVCHDKKEDHEMVYATRMICGHCCREQNFSASRPCGACGQHLTKIRTAHWEGGSGCRDKVSMSKSDQQKYKNMNKTLSNHQKKLQTSGHKKATKLRHA